MIRIILDDDQIKTLQSVSEAVEVCDRTGNLLGYMARRPSDEDVKSAKKRLASNGPWLTTQQLLDQLPSLEQG